MHFCHYPSRLVLGPQEPSGGCPNGGWGAAPRLNPSCLELRLWQAQRYNLWEGLT